MPKRDEGALAQRATYKAYHMVSTRWADNDQYGHINNAKFYEFVDSAVNAHLLIANALNESIGLVVDSGCRYTSSLKFPDVIEVGIKVDRIGTSSVSYGFAVFKRASTSPPPSAISSTSMSTPKPAGPSRCPNACAPWWRTCGRIEGGEPQRLSEAQPGSARD